MTEDKAASVENSAEDKKEMPPAYDEANPLTTEEPSVKITSNETKIDIGNEKAAASFQVLTNQHHDLTILTNHVSGAYQGGVDEVRQ